MKGKQRLIFRALLIETDGDSLFVSVGKREYQFRALLRRDVGWPILSRV